MGVDWLYSNLPSGSTERGQGSAEPGLGSAKDLTRRALIGENGPHGANVQPPSGKEAQYNGPKPLSHHPIRMLLYKDEDSVQPQPCIPQTRNHEQGTHPSSGFLMQDPHIDSIHSSSIECKE